MSILKGLLGEAGTATTSEGAVPEESIARIQEVTIIDVMTEIQVLDKPTDIKKCVDLASHFATRLGAKYS